MLFSLTIQLQTSTEEDTSYSPVSDKEKEDPQSGTYIGLSPKGDPWAWGGGEWSEGRFVHRQPSEIQIGIWVFRREIIVNISFMIGNLRGGGLRATGGKHVFSFKHTVLYVLILATQSYLKSRSSTIYSQKKFDIHSKTLCRGLPFAVWLNELLKAAVLKWVEMESLLCGDPKQTNPPFYPQVWDHFDFSAMVSPYFT